MQDYLKIFSQRSFLGLYIGQVISRLGDGIASIVIVWGVWKLTSSPLLVSLAFVSQTLPQLIFSFIGGITADRFVHKNQMIISDIVRLLITVVAAITSWAGALNHWYLMLAGFLLTSAGCFFNPARAALLPRIVPSDLLQSANELISGSFHGAVLVGPIIGGWLMNYTDIGTLLLVNAVTFGASILGLLVLPSTFSTSGEQRRSIYVDVQGGFNTVVRTPVLAWIVGTFWIGTFLCGGVGDVGRTMLVDQLGAGAVGLGLMSTAMGLGLMVGSFWVAHIKIRHRVRAVMTAWIVDGALFALMGISPKLWFALAVSFLAGVTTAFINVPTESSIQLYGKENTGKVFGCWTITIWLG